MRFLRVVPAILLPLALSASAARAQDPVECPLDIFQPNQLAQAGLTIGRAAAAGESPEAVKLLRDAMKFLQDEKKLASNPVGTAYLRSQIYILWLHQDGIGETLTLEELNAKGPKTNTVDLVAAADSGFDAVEALGPTCGELTTQWRGAKPWTDRINKAYTFLGAEEVDSAAYWAERSALLFADSPFIENIFAQIANKRGDVPLMMTHLRKAIAMADMDTSLAETKSQMQFQLAQTASGYAMTEGSADKEALTKEALGIYATLLRDRRGTPEGAYAFSAASEIVTLSQDSVAARELIAPLIEDPSHYTDLTLLLAADVSRIFSRSDDAMAMYVGALSKNPNIRDANYFLAFMYYEAKQPEKMIPLTDKLIEIDPGNGDNLLMRAYAYQLMAAVEKDPKKKVELVKQQDAYAARENAMPHKLLVSRFERRAAGAALGGTIENLSKAARAYTVEMEFLDLEGNVVEAMTMEVPSVKPGERGEFEFVPTKPGIVAYRYAALK